MAKPKKSTFERLRSGQMNRQQRRDLGRRLAGNDPGLTIVHSNAGGIVGNESHFVAVPPDRDPNPVQEIGCWTADLKRMAAWLSACRIDTVAMQASRVARLVGGRRRTGPRQPMCSASSTMIPSGLRT